jgi:hypothetical protein
MTDPDTTAAADAGWRGRATCIGTSRAPAVIERRRGEGVFGGFSGLALLSLFGIHYVVSGVVPTGRFPSPFVPEAELREFFARNETAIRALSAVDIFTAVVLLCFTAAVVGWLQLVAAERRVAIAVALSGGVAASVFTGFAALGLWVLSRSETTDDAGVVAAIDGLVYQAGGPALVLTTGVLMAAGSVACWSTPTVWRPIPWIGIAGAIVSAAAVPAMYWEPVTWVLPVSRFFLGAWILGLALTMSGADRWITARAGSPTTPEHQ